MEIPNFDQEKSPLEIFRKEIDKIVSEELETAHFSDSFSSEELNEDDRALFQKYNNGTLSQEDLASRTAQLQQSGNESQKQFLGYLANKLQVRWSNER